MLIELLYRYDHSFKLAVCKMTEIVWQKKLASHSPDCWWQQVGYASTTWVWCTVTVTVIKFAIQCIEGELLVQNLGQAHAPRYEFKFGRNVCLTDGFYRIYTSGMVSCILTTLWNYCNQFGNLRFLKSRAPLNSFWTNFFIIENGAS